MSRSELGRTRLYTRRERRRRILCVLVAVTGALAAAWLAAGIVTWLSTGDLTWPSLGLRPPLTDDDGGRGLLGLPRVETTPGPVDTEAGEDQTAGEGAWRWQVPVTVGWPAPAAWTVLVALPLWLAWLWFAVRPAWVGLREQARHHGLAAPRQIRRVLGVRALRRTGRYTMPGTTRWARLLRPPHSFGYPLGHHTDFPRPHTTRQIRYGRGPRLWADWEQRIRVVARTGWGKTDRVLIPIIRTLPGPALIASIEPGIFDKTVLARRYRRPSLRWPWLTRILHHWLPPVEYPVAVMDVSAPDRRYTAGYPQIRWSPITGCTDYTIAHRRAVALVTGIDTTTPHTSGSDNDRFFRDSAAEVLAAWFHAADLAAKDIDDLADWLRHTDDPTPTRILRDHPHAEPSAAVNITRHLDPTAGRTTSGVLRYLTLALNSLTATEGRRLCARHHENPFDLEQLITTGGTIYLLADSSRLPRIRPLLSLFAAETFLAAEAVALRTRHRRLPQPFIGVIDELRHGIPIPNLPYIASAQRKHGIGYIYSVQTTTQEDTLYGPDAPALRAAAGVSIIGGLDIDSAHELTERAGTTPVVTPTRNSRRDTGTSEQLHHQNTLTIADQQQLPDGHAIIITRGLPPFLATIPSYRDTRTLNRTMARLPVSGQWT